MPAQESPLKPVAAPCARPRARGRRRRSRRGQAWASLTWNELYRRVIDGAAGMIEAGVNPGQVVVIRVPTGIRQLELELATRVAGAVPLLLPERMDPAEVGRLLDEIEVRLVVVDHESRLTLLRRAGLADAQLFECDDRSWERLRGMGLERRKRQPDVLSWVATPYATGRTSAPVLGLPREKSRGLALPARVPPARCPTSPPTTSCCSPARRPTASPPSCATPTSRPGARWRGSRRPTSSRPRSRTSRRPTSSSTTSPRGAWRTCSRSVPPSTAPRGTRRPRDVLEAASAQAAEARLSSRTRKLAADVTCPGALVGRPAAGARPRRPRQPHRQRPRDGAGLPHRSHRPPPGGPARAGARARGRWPSPRRSQHGRRPTSAPAPASVAAACASGLDSAFSLAGLPARDPSRRLRSGRR